MNDEKRLKLEDEVMQLAREMPRDVQPDNDLWPGIASAISEDRAIRGTGWPRMFAQAAAVLVLIGASSGLTWLTLQNDDSVVVVQNGNPGLVFEPVSGSFGSQYALGPEFQDARDGLLSSLDEELDKLEPETRIDIEKNIETIRTAIMEINKALAEQPDNALLQELLINAYREELLILRTVDDITGSVMRRTDI